jgi:hypothetical protein
MRFADLRSFAVVIFVPEKIEKQRKGVNPVESTERSNLSELQR